MEVFSKLGRLRVKVLSYVSFLDVIEVFFGKYDITVFKGHVFVSFTHTAGFIEACFYIRYN